MQYRWSSARAHVFGNDPEAILDMEWWEQARQVGRWNWESHLLREDEEGASALRACTYAGRPFAEETMVNELGKRFHRTWTRGRPKQREHSGARATRPDKDQFELFEK